MISKLPGWVFIGGLVLAAVAGFVNAVGLLGLNHPVSHMTGNLTLFSESFTRRDIGEAFQSGMLVVAFFLGAVLCGFIVQKSTLRLGRRYGAALAMMSKRIAIAAWNRIRRKCRVNLMMEINTCEGFNVRARRASPAISPRVAVDSPQPERQPELLHLQRPRLRSCSRISLH